MHASHPLLCAILGTYQVNGLLVSVQRAAFWLTAKYAGHRLPRIAEAPLPVIDFDCSMEYASDAQPVRHGLVESLERLWGIVCVCIRFNRTISHHTRGRRLEYSYLCVADVINMEPDYQTR